jgi:hypothetical protein
MLALLVAVVVSAEPAACSTDADCVLITGCGCSCCPLPLEAVTKAEAEATRRRCATLGECGDLDCARKKFECAPVEDPAQVKAVCRASRCVKELVPKPECTSDADCAMGHDCTCDCCPAPWKAMPKSQADALRRKCARLGPCRPPEEQCRGVKCAPSVEQAAVCREARCVAAPTKR